MKKENNPQKSTSLGRKTGSQNKITKVAKSIVFDMTKEDLSKLDRGLRGLPFDERLTHLKYFAKFLAAGNDEISLAVRNIIFKELEPHFRKMGSYIGHVDQNKKISELRAFLKLLAPDKIEFILKDMNDRQRIRFIR